MLKKKRKGRKDFEVPRRQPTDKENVTQAYTHIRCRTCRLRGGTMNNGYL